MCRSYAARGVVDGHGLLHELMSDVMEDLLGRNTASSAGPLTAADSWLTVSSVTSDICWNNAVGKLRVSHTTFYHRHIGS